ncbi:type II toxin-antitoxin system HipA family toxin [Lichenibacterium ramalinae]|uniref:Type II toxin-antitoxin system HipA family toxin n=2 Tax=Lichenibacterium ramalinae TaxID=2316527 RepID=A0A4Q2RDM5_9HYPH|nr:type II toxin-antitoxin system HipA family toxin [Lichenibacterium ramalinae]
MWELSEAGRIDTLFVFRRSGTGHVVVGVLVFEGRGRVRRGRFQYAPSYLRDGGRWAIDPVSLQLGPRWRNASPSEAPLAFHDSGPDGWGKSIVDRAYPDLELGMAEYLASRGGRRTGDLLYGPTPERPDTWRPTAEPSRGSAAEDDVGMLLDAAMEAEEGTATADQLALLVPSSAVGGARPKARVRVDGVDWIAKFPASSDRFDDPRMEAVCLDVAEAAGIAVPERRLLRLRRGTALLVRRFDRDERGGALAYLSAGTLLRQGIDVYGTNQTYLDIALVGQRIGVPGTREEMYRRYVVNSLLHNTDDHLRNHAFIGDAGGWRLSPAFDVVPHVGRQTHVCAAAPGIGHGRDPLGARHVHRRFGFDATIGEAVYERALTAFSRIREFMDAREVTEGDRAFVLHRLGA